MRHLTLLAWLCVTPVAAQDWAERKPVSVGAGDYLVAVAPDRSAALVGPAKRSTRMTTRTVERAAQAATGCRAFVDRKIAMFTGGNENEQINMNSVPGGQALRVRLRC